MIIKDKSSTLRSIFKRKGAEGEYTKVIDNNSIEKYSSSLSVSLQDDEIGLILYHLNSSNWVFLTNKRLFYKKDSVTNIIDHNNIRKVSLALDIEFKAGIRDKKEFTRLLIEDEEGQNHLLNLEKGEPFEGFYQVLHFLSTQAT